MAEFVHLHVHSEYSLLDGAARVGDLAAEAARLGMPALAVTDHGAMYGSAGFYKKAKAAGVKPIIGCEAYFTPGSRKERGGKTALYHLLLLAKDRKGYQNLMAIVSRSFMEGFYYKPQVDEELLREYHEGLICTSACLVGAVARSVESGDMEGAGGWAEKYRDIFGEDFYLEVQDQGIVGDSGVPQSRINEGVAEIARELGIPLVGTNDIHYVGREDAQAQDILLCIGTGSNLDDSARLRFSSDQFYMKTAEEMAEALSDYPEALAHTLEIAERCNVELEFDRILLPAFEVPSGHDLDSYLEERCVEGLARRYGDPVPQRASDRLEHELAIIREKEFSGYFLVVEDFVRWAKERRIGVGPGRGSAAGSIIAYALGITNLDPLEHGLIFERFLNPERTEMPDIDIDFDDERRGDVIEYVRERYGEDKVAQIITFSTLKARMAVRDAGRVLGYPYGVPDRIAKQIQEGPDASIEDSLRTNPELREEYEAGGDTRRIIDAAESIEGMVRGDGVHAAGVVICGESLDRYTPVKRTKGDEGEVVTQYDGKLIAELGLLKMDFLGLRTLTVIADAVRAIEKNHDVHIDIEDIPMDDARTWELLRRADTAGVFQVESQGMRRVLRDLKPTKIADLVAVVALFRPGPMDSIPDFIARKHGKQKVEYYHENLEPILAETYGTMVYQEQVMQISMEMAGFSAAKAERLRKGMGKKIQEVVDRLEIEFIEGSVARGYDARLARRVWNDMREFAKYAFNKSHAAAYGLISYQTAYLKAHYPLEYMAAVLTSYMGNTDRLVRYLAECNKAGIEVLPPDVNTSGRDFTVVGDSIRFGLSGVRNVGVGVVLSIMDGRAEGPYASLHDLCGRVDLKQVNKRALEALIKAGAFDSTGYTRKHLTSLVPECVEAGLKRRRDKEMNQTSLFDLEDAAEHGFIEEVPEPDGDEWDKRIKLAFEKEMLGIYVSDHPLREIAGTIKGARDRSMGDQEEFRDGETGRFAGIVTSVNRFATKRGQMMMGFTIEDLEGSMEAVLFPQIYQSFSDLLSEDSIVRIRARVEVNERGRKLLVQEVQPLSGDGRFERAPGIVDITLDEDALLADGPDGPGRLKGILERYPGCDRVHACLQSNGRKRELRMPDELRVDAGVPGLHAELKEWPAVLTVRER